MNLLTILIIIYIIYFVYFVVPALCIHRVTFLGKAKTIYSNHCKKFTTYPKVLELLKLNMSAMALNSLLPWNISKQFDLS